MIRNVENEQNERPQVIQQKNVKTYIPVVTYAIIAVNVLIFIFVNVLSGGRQLPYLAVSRKEFSVYKLVSAMFAHGSLQHIFCNMLSLYSVGAGLEHFLGRAKYTMLYFFAGIGSSVAVVLFSDHYAVGASGAIFGLVGFYLMLALMNRDKLGETLRKNILPPLLINLLVTVIVPGISIAGHFGGLIAGMIFYLIFFRNIRLVYRNDVNE